MKFAEMTTQYINRTFPIRVQNCPKKGVHSGPEMASKVQLPVIPHGMHPHSGKCDLMQLDMHGKAPLNGVATPDLWAYLPGPRISNIVNYWKLMGHGHVLSASPCTMVPLLLDHVTPKSISLTHNVLVKIPFAPLIIAMYGPHAKMQNISVLMLHACLEHDFLGMACNHGRRSPVKEGWG